ncbi:glycoside hydrolase domain-containing protein [Corynebacterium sp.]|uniref:glycoside hydrolase domain-containing protein n=1 Tax=Corynebacterium sp. TaxID=1720 RepID=UPI0025BCD287|nr:glycoside hydrolase domain-containing protein [Corynebacterium sp.]
MSTVIDFSASFPSGAAIKRAGHEGVVAYISPAREAWMKAKPLTKAKVDEYKAAGLKIAVVWQYGAGTAASSDVMRGAAGGRADAEAAQKQLNQIGLAGHPVFFAVDFDISLAQWNATAVEYFKAAGAVLGKQRVGIYGHSKVVHWAMEDDVVATVAPGRVLGWVTRSWSSGVVGADYSVLYQRQHNVPGPDGVQIDVNDVHVPEWGHRALPKPPAVDLTRLPKVDETIWLNKHFTTGRKHRGVQKRVEYITRHHMGGIGGTQQCWNWWQDRKASAHFAVDPHGKVGQLVREEDTAWSNADDASNAVSIAIEHSNSSGPAQDWPISDKTIDAGARLAAELCMKHGLGRPVFGRNIRDHCEFGATACPYHLRNGGKYHARWMRVAQEHYDELRRASTETPKENTVTDYSKLLLEQLAGPGKTKGGAPSFGGWDIDSIIAAGKKKLRDTGGCTVPEMIAIVGEDKLRAIIAEGKQS